MKIKYYKWKIKQLQWLYHPEKRCKHWWITDTWKKYYVYFNDCGYVYAFVICIDFGFISSHGKKSQVMIEPMWSW